MTLGDLRVAVSQEEAEAALFAGDYETYDGWMRPATLADLVSALRAEGMLVVEDWGEWQVQIERLRRAAREPYWSGAHRDLAAFASFVLDALAEGQP